MRHKKLIIIAIALSSISTTQCFSEQQLVEIKKAVVVKSKNSHGHGKKPLDCPMKSMEIINAEGKLIADMDYSSLLTLRANDVAHSGHRKMKKENPPVFPLAQLMEEQQLKGDVIAFSCDSNESVKFTADEVMKDHRRLLLTLNHAGRLRLADFNYDRRRYYTKVKNLVRIEIRTPQN